VKEEKKLRYSKGNELFGEVSMKYSVLSIKTKNRNKTKSFVTLDNSAGTRS